MESKALDGIAVIGMAARFPKARNTSEYWENLCAGRECLDEFTEGQIVSSGVSRESLCEERVRSRGVLQDADCFDASFFGYSPREAEIMDPQQRVLLELAWQAVEDAGYSCENTPGLVGVFAGVGINTYFPNNVKRRPDIFETFGNFPAILLNEKDFAATRIAYKLNLRGPAVSVQTACSTSLVAVCNACQSLLNYECDLALAGAVGSMFPQCHSYVHEEGGMISLDGHCRPFDARSGGTLFSDGGGVVVLRRLEDAIAANDNILAVIKGFAVNNDGSAKAGFTAPSVDGQAEVIRMAQAFGDVPPDSISYVEAHGTGTALGDPIEVAALTQAFRAGTDKKQFCGIGSVKSNIGHLDVAAGIAGLIKAVLCLKHRTLPPTLHYDQPNPEIDFESSPFFVVDRLTNWESADGPRRAGVSSFGIGGTNAHVVLEEAPELALDSVNPAACHLLVLSAKTGKALDAATSNLLEHLRREPHGDLSRVAFTLQSGRCELSRRRTVVCSGVEAAVAALSQKGGARVTTGSTGGRTLPVVFMFPGQGSQRVGMGRELYAEEPVFRRYLDECADILRPIVDCDLRDLLYPAPANVSWAEDLLIQTRYTQPALFSVEFALAQLWMSYGVKPAAMIGHSVGEYVAAALAGVFSLEDGLKLIADRGRIIQEQPGGTMLAVVASLEEVSPYLSGSVSIAAINSPNVCVVSGPTDELEEFAAKLEQVNLPTRLLHTSHAFHSAMMDSALEPFAAALDSVSLHPPSIPFISNVTGAWAEPEEVTKPSYWTRHLREAVRFADGAGQLLSRDYAYLEVGPGSTLSSLMRQQAGATQELLAVASLPARKGSESEIQALYEAVGGLWQSGAPIDWKGFQGGRKARRASLPTYPFERIRYYIHPDPHRTTPRASEHASVALNDALTSFDAVPPDRGGGRPDPVAPAPAALEILGRKLEDLLGLEAGSVSVAATFADMGMDSLQLAQFSRVIETTWGIRIPARCFASSRASLQSISGELAELARKSGNSRGKASFAKSHAVDESENERASGDGGMAAISSELDGISGRLTELAHCVAILRETIAAARR